MAWSGSPYVKCEVISSNGTVVGSSILNCWYNVNKNTNASTSQAPQGSVTFTVNSTDNYTIRWTPVADATGKAAAWVEAVIGHIKITQRSGSRAIALGEEEDGATDVQEVETQRFERNVFYNLNGQKVDNPSRGIFLYNGRKVIINK